MAVRSTGRVQSYGFGGGGRHDIALLFSLNVLASSFIPETQPPGNQACLTSVSGDAI